MANSSTPTNLLIHASSPYLLQHAHNPVHWHEWNAAAWQKAREENKLVLVSIGYSACHWCHVVERETFENEETAAIMNEYFVCIKVDREERPDVDQVYMDAVQLITGRGGWPLNMFCLPDGRPLHGGTYFPNTDWNRVLLQLHQLYTQKYDEAVTYAEKLTEGIRNMEIIKFEGGTTTFTESNLQEMYATWATQFDWKDGGNARVPKFPLPDNFRYLLDYGKLFAHEESLKFTQFTLTKMAQGGIYDQLGGGFARYSVDGYWLVPHFEKMLYDNAQLTGLYASAYRATGNEFFRETALQTIGFLKRELLDPSGGFYSALDADSEGEEGKFYVWSKTELENLLGADEPLFSAWYQCTAEGNWEHGKNILHTRTDTATFAILYKVDETELLQVIARSHTRLMAYREQRIRPGLDDKIILCWNALLLKALAEAYQAFGDPALLELALGNYRFIRAHLVKEQHLFRIYKDGKTTIPAFLEDYAALVQALIALYQVTFDEEMILLATGLVETVMREFSDEETGLFYFTSLHDDPLVSRKKDLTDDVIPSANAMLALGLHQLFYYTGNTDYRERAARMLAAMKSQVIKFPSWYSHWAQLALLQAEGVKQLVFSEAALPEVLATWKTHYQPNVLLGCARENSTLPLLAGRFSASPRYYVCHEETCSLPVNQLFEALNLLAV